MELQSTVYHIPALLEECIDGLAIKPGGTYVDVTFGGGGHSRAILGHLGEAGRLFRWTRTRMPGATVWTIAGLHLFTVISGI